MAHSDFEPGDLVQLHYGDGEWHERLLLRRTTPAVMESQIGEVPASDCVWWVVTPSFDVFPEEVNETPQLHVRAVHDGAALGVRRARAGFSARDPTFRFSAGQNLARVFLDALKLVPGTEDLTVGMAPLPAARPGYVWQVLNEDVPVEKDEVLNTAGWRGVASGRCALGVSDAGPLCLEQVRRESLLPAGNVSALPGMSAAGAAAAAGGDDEDVRVLPVQWRGGRRFRDFAESLRMMEFFNFGDCELEG